MDDRSGGENQWSYGTSYKGQQSFYTFLNIFWGHICFFGGDVKIWNSELSQSVLILNIEYVLHQWSSQWWMMEYSIAWCWFISSYCTIHNYTTFYAMEQLVNYQAQLSTIWDLLPLPNVGRRSDIPDYSSPHLRTLQGIPDYSSPPTEYAISLTPKGYRPNFVIDSGINLAGLGLCNEPENFEACQIIFTPPKEFLEHDNSKVGVLFYGGALVDPRGYSPIAHQLSDRYGLPVVIPFFKDNIAFDSTCNLKRVELESASD